MFNIKILEKIDLTFSRAHLDRELRNVYSLLEYTFEILLGYGNHTTYPIFGNIITRSFVKRNFNFINAAVKIVKY